MTLDFHEFREVAVHSTADPEVVAAEYDAHGVATGTGRPFAVRCLWVLKISGGRIAFWRDYLTPQEILALQEPRVPGPAPRGALDVERAGIVSGPCRGCAGLVGLSPARRR
ncbi:hypothetical protein HDA32_002211 [Spinactinospora alkalitolerans]|uniref:Limonene-1,2-epoxide hydrolase domain-containing protein n=1 Tax=Spinactinospora alkalitolerans TaxID=687207 RepID=A0A852TTV7_9ACTN|nr:nuclear transport factor 2 family protein [Spinactinospora alkalitolerans]NYE47091.1 hypothetical protein [Spinactinospora alkalitolerans]